MNITVELPAHAGAIEQLLLAGPANSEGVEQKQFEIYHARSILRRLVWLQRKKIPVSFDIAG